MGMCQPHHDPAPLGIPLAAEGSRGAELALCQAVAQVWHRDLPQQLKQPPGRSTSAGPGPQAQL